MMRRFSRNLFPHLKKHGDKVFVEKLDKSQSHMTDIKRGPIYEPGEVVKL